MGVAGIQQDETAASCGEDGEDATEKDSSSRAVEDREDAAG